MELPIKTTITFGVNVESRTTVCLSVSFLAWFLTAAHNHTHMWETPLKYAAHKVELKIFMLIQYDFKHNHCYY